MVVNSGYFSVVVFVCFPSLGYAGGGLSDACVFVGAVSFFGSKFDVLVLSVTLRLRICIVKSGISLGISCFLHRWWLKALLGIVVFRLGKFSSMILLNIFSVPLRCVFPPLLPLLFLGLLFSWCPRFPGCFVLGNCWI